ncbi:MAG: hypothetical protein U0326_37335 [Polyangiales bacterium]
MSSTESAALGALFDDVIAPASERARAAGRSPFPPRPMPPREELRDPPAAAMRREDFAAPSCDGFDDFERRLAAHWRALGREALAARSDRFAEAARAVYALADGDSEVSPFVYVMF